jgi:hypothetical protein
MGLPTGRRAKLNTLAFSLGLAALAIGASPAGAVTTISSSAYGLGVDLSILTLVDVGVGPTAVYGGTAPIAYGGSQSVASVNASVGLLIAALSVNTGLLKASASSPFTPTPTGTATGEVDGLGSGLALLVGGTVLDISADTIKSTSSVSGAGALDATGATTLENLKITGLSALGGTDVDLSGTVTPVANDVVFNSNGLEIELNQQTHTGANGPASSSDGMTTNALVIDFKNFLLGGDLLNGSFIVGHSQADIEGSPVGAVPEPAAWIEMLAGVGLLGFVARRRRRHAASRPVAGPT